MIGKIIKIISNQYTVYDNGSRINCIALGRMRKTDKPIVGDNVLYSLIDDKYCIEKIYPRENQLIRPLISNIDQAMIVSSAKEPDFSSVLVDRLIFLVSYYGIKPVIVITKMDLVKADNDWIYDYIRDYRKSGYTVIEIGHDYDLTVLKQNLKGKVTVLAGQSGVGKSSLLNKLDSNFALHTQEISKALNRGKHTTKYVKLYKLNEGSYIFDTPGFSSYELYNIEHKKLKEYYPEFFDCICEYDDCRHVIESEKVCNVKSAVKSGKIDKGRYERYVYIYNKLKENYERRYK